MIKASAPSNIALIKYMGKIDSQSNIPSNASLSFTLENLQTTVVIEKNNSKSDSWGPLTGSDFYNLQLSEKGVQKFLNHFARLKKEFAIEGHYDVKSANNFPSDAGLASSASSFAALTEATFLLKKSADSDFTKSKVELAALSRMGSGSSCRSFFTPWSIWDEKGAREIDIPIKNLIHKVFIYETSAKKVSSSEAHQRVVASPLFAKDSSGFSRIERAESRLQNLLQAFTANNWRQAYEICWEEFWDMHELFHTCNPSFTYLTDEVCDVLKKMKKKWDSEGRGPLITLDAGPNIHCLFREEDLDIFSSWENEFTPKPKELVLESKK